MKQFLAMAGPIAVNLVFWSVITILPLHPVILLILVVGSTTFMMFGIVYLQKKADKNP